MSENGFSLSTHKLTRVDIVVPVLGTVGYGNIMNSIWINNFLHSCNTEWKREYKQDCICRFIYDRN